jgi:phosphoglycerate dehydrogenase-like enzyme
MDKLVVGILWPAAFDTDGLLAGIGSEAAERVEVVCAHYEEDHELRTLRATERDRGVIRSRSPEITPALKDVLGRSEAIMALDVPVDLVELAPNLRWIQAIGAGTNQFDHEGLRHAGIRLTSAAGVGAPPIAEFVIGRLLEVWKHARELEQYQREHRWVFTQGRLLAGCTLGIVGLGAIGSEIARRARGLDMRVIATRRSYQPGMTHPHADELFGPDDLDTLLERSDALVLCAPATDETADLIGAAQLARMKPGAVLCNVARGTLVDEDALVDALRSGHIGAAILDVMRREPLPPDDPLWDAPNTYLSPHSSTSREGYDDRLRDLLGRNLVRFLADEPLVNVVV